ncbi:MAG: VWA domain-containing protein [Thermodesulfobacteriota bacterium]|nr:VWA domain-containing protein [Thermodesulfobacteriota bacterium]
MVRKNNDIALDATLRAAAPYQKWRDKGDLAVRIMTSDIREKIRERKMRSLFIFIVDSSGSMGAQLMSTTKGAILNFLLEAYQKRDRVSLVAFRGKGSELILPPTSSVEIAKRKLEGLPTGGQTSLTAGLLQGYQVARMQKNRDKGIKPVIVLITDGRANVSADPGHPVYRPNSPRAVGEVFAVAEKIGAQIWLESMVIDTEKKNPGAFDFAKDIAEHLRASYISIDNINSETVLNAIHSTQRSEWQK